MKRSTTTAGILAAALALGGAGSAHAQSDVEKFATFYNAVNGTPAGEMIELSIIDFVLQMTLGEDDTQLLAQEAGLTEAAYRLQLAQNLAPYREVMGANLLAGTTARMEPGQIALLAGVAGDDSRREAVECVMDQQAQGRQPDWEVCNASIPQDFRDSYARYTLAINEAFNDDPVLDYFGGLSCRLANDYADRVTTETTSLSFSNMTISLGSHQDVPCEEWEARLARREAI